MRNKDCIDYLKAKILAKELTISAIARAIAADRSQVSRILAGQFVKMEGRALEVCNFARSFEYASAHKDSGPSAPKMDLEEYAQRVAALSPAIANTLTELMKQIVDEMEEGDQLERDHGQKVRYRSRNRRKH